MKQPKLSDLRIDEKETLRIREQMKKKIKITINIDEDLIKNLKILSQKTGVPYQKIFNNLLRDTLNGKKEDESRLDKIERELEKLKRLLKKAS